MARIWPLFLALLLGAAALGLGLQLGDGPADGWQLAGRYTARVAFCFFIVAYSASSLLQLWPRAFTKGLMAQRRWWGLGFALVHTVHLIALVFFLKAQTTLPSPVILVTFASLGYVPAYLMAATSFPWAYRALGKRWRLLHTICLHILWVDLMFAYGAKALSDADQRLPGAVLATVGIAALLLRISARFRVRRLRATAAPA